MLQCGTPLEFKSQHARTREEQQIPKNRVLFFSDEAMYALGEAELQVPKNSIELFSEESFRELGKIAVTGEIEQHVPKSGIPLFSDESLVALGQLRMVVKDDVTGEVKKSPWGIGYRNTAR